jgi:chromosome segregation ATPase
MLRTEQVFVQQLRTELLQKSSELEQQRGLVTDEKIRHQTLMEEQAKRQQALIEEQKKREHALKEERKKQEQALVETHRRELDRQIHQNENERSHYFARVDALRSQLEELHDTSTKNESRLNVVITQLSAALDHKTGEHAGLLADFELSKGALEDARTSLAANRDLSERLASELKQVRARQEELQADISGKKATIDGMNREIYAHRKHTGDLQTLLVDRNGQNQEMMIRIEALYASRSWRMTGPLRAARRFFSKVTNRSRSAR